MKYRWIRSSLLLAAVVGTGVVLAAWKLASLQASDAGLANQPEKVCRAQDLLSFLHCPFIAIETRLPAASHV